MLQNFLFGSKQSVIFLGVGVLFILALLFMSTIIQPNRPANRRYISPSVKECALIDFGCNTNERLFNDSTGCGCEK